MNQSPGLFAFATTLLTAMLFCTVVCGSVAEGATVTIEDRIGEVATLDGRPSIPSYISGFSVLATVGRYHASQSVRLTEVEGIGVPYSRSGGAESITGYSWKMVIHSNQSQAINMPLTGDVLPVTPLPTPIIQTAGSDSLGHPSYQVRFDLNTVPSLDSIFLSGGSDYWITVLGESLTEWAWMESVSAGESDTFTVDNVFIGAWTDNPILETGRSALRFTGEITVPEPGTSILLLGLLPLLATRTNRV